MGVLEPFVFTLDHAQRRVERDRNTLLVQGSYQADGSSGRVLGWDPVQISNCWWDPVTYTGMLKPAPLLEAWRTTFTGIYARLQKSDFTLDDSSNWSNVAGAGGSTDYVLYKSTATNEGGITSTTWDKNRGFYIKLFSFNGANERFPQLKFGWNSTKSDAAGVSGILYANGDVDIQKDGELVGQGSISGARGSSSLQNQDVGLLLIPCRGRDLLIISDQGNGFQHTFEDIDEGEADPTITGATKFWFEVVQGTAAVQIAPIRFPSSGYLCGRLSYFAEPPALGDPLLTPTPYSGSPGYGTQSLAMSMREASSIGTVFVPDGVKFTAYVRFDFTGDGESTNFLYGGAAGYGPTITDTDASEAFILDDYLVSRTLDVPEDPAGVRLALTIESPADLEDEGIASIETQHNRPLELSNDGIQIIDGRGGPPETEYSANERATRVMLEVRDTWAMLEQYRFRDAVPLDGTDWHAAVTFVLTLAGVDPLRVDAEDPGYTIPNVPQSAGQWSVLIEAGDSAAEAVQKLFDIYAGDWWYCFVPTAAGIDFKARSPLGLDTTPVLHLYDTADASIAQLLLEGYTSAEASRIVSTRLYQSLIQRTLPPEATEVRITGYDRRAGRPIQSYYIDAAAEDPAEPPSTRPANWLGTKMRYGLADGAFSTQALCNRGTEQLGPRLTRARTLGEITCQMLFKDDGLPLWRGDLIELEGRGEWRVTAFSTDFIKEPLAGGFGRELWQGRPSRYVLEKWDAGTPWSAQAGGSSIRDIERLARERNRRRGRTAAGWEFLRANSPFVVSTN